MIAELNQGAESRVLYAGETENVMGSDLAARLEEVRERWRDAELLLRLNVRRAVRQAEQEDLIAGLLPPLNDAPLRVPGAKGKRGSGSLHWLYTIGVPGSGGTPV